MEPHQTIVTTVLTAKSSAEITKKARPEAGSENMRREIGRSPIAAMKSMTLP
jgi:hypothetical protein